MYVTLGYNVTLGYKVILGYNVTLGYSFLKWLFLVNF